MPSNACFQEINSIGIGKLKRILLAVAWLYPDIGYCQGMGMVRELCFSYLYWCLIWVVNPL